MRGIIVVGIRLRIRNRSRLSEVGGGVGDVCIREDGGWRVGTRASIQAYEVAFLGLYCAAGHYETILCL